MYQSNILIIKKGTSLNNDWFLFAVLVSTYFWFLVTGFTIYPYFSMYTWFFCENFILEQIIFIDCIQHVLYLFGGGGGATKLARRCLVINHLLSCKLYATCRIVFPFEERKIVVREHSFHSGYTLSLK